MGVSCSLPREDLVMASLAHFLKQTFLCFQVPTARTTAIQMGPGLPHTQTLRAYKLACLCAHGLSILQEPGSCRRWDMTHV